MQKKKLQAARVAQVWRARLCPACLPPKFQRVVVHYVSRNFIFERATSRPRRPQRLVTNFGRHSRGQDGNNNNLTRRIRVLPDTITSLKMPPPIPRASLRALSTPTSASTVRPFSSTPTILSDVPIPPESPRFIPLPDLPQSDETKKPLVRGRLPVPREIFTKRAHGEHKRSASFVQDTAPRSKAERRGEAPKSDKDGWKRLMAESRRQALGDGIGSLWKRKVKRETRAKARADAHGQRNLEDKFAPERLDEVYTRGTIPAATLDTRVIRDPEHDTKQRESALRTAAVQQAKSQARKDAIQRLYVEATNFIVTEDELGKKVDQLFKEDYFKDLGVARGIYWGAENVWETSGPPTTVKQMYANMKGTSSLVTESFRTASSKTVQRQRIVAGELTGGALSVDLLPDPELKATKP